MQMSLITVVIALTLLTACAPRQMTADKHSISFTVKTGLVSNNTGDAQERANTHCAKFGKDTALKSMNQISVNRTVAVFECIKRD